MTTRDSELQTATKAQAERAAKKVGATLDDNSGPDHIDICVQTPKGVRLKATGCHSAVTWFPRARPGDGDPYSGSKANGWAGVINDLSYGVEPCDEPNCGFCERGLQNV
jgi:hypothetical protein